MLRSLEARVPPPVWTLAAAVAMSWIARRSPWAGWSAGDFRVPRSVFAVALGIGGLALAGESLLRFVRLKTTFHPTHPARATALVTSGAYRYTRNPMYLGLLLLLLGWAVWLASAAALLVVPAWMLVLTRLQIEPEERALLDVFGGEYAAYRDEVRRWLGRR